MRWIWIVIGLLLLPSLALAQEEDGGTILSRLLEDQLSDGAARQVSIQGFEGALSSQATLDRLTISDVDGAWLILEGATLDWNRSALLRGALQVNALTAERLEVIRPPLTEDSVDVPSAEAQPFSLPNLPVSVEIGEFAINEVVLGEALFGIAAQLSIDGTASLLGGSGAADIHLNRLDGPRGQFDLNAAFENDTRELSLSLILDEEPGGLAAELLGLPGRPDLNLSVQGNGPLDAFTADIALATDGQDRITGQVISTESDDGTQTLTADIGGDITPLLLPEYQEFFGDDTRLRAEVAQSESGGTTLDELSLQSAALDLQGDLALGPNGLPTRLNLTGAITPPDGDTVRLPSTGADVRLRAATLALTYDREAGENYALTADIDGLTADDFALETTALRLEGIAAITDTGVEAATAVLQAQLDGATHTDPALAEAIGEALSVAADLSWVNGAPVILSDLTVASGDMQLAGNATAMSGEGVVDVALDLAAEIGALDRFAAIAGQPLTGSVTTNISGQVEALSGAFDLSLSGTGQDLVFVDNVPPELFAGQTDLNLRAIRDGSGTRIEDLTLENAELALTGDVSVSSGDTSLQADFDLADVGLFTDMLSGPASIRADIARSGTEPFNVDVSLRGPSDILADITGALDAETQDFSLVLVASAQDLSLGDAVPPELLSGRTDLTAQLIKAGETFSLSNFELENTAIQASGDARLGPSDSDVSLEARLADIGVFTDMMSGPVTINGDVARTGTDPFNVNLALRGSSEIAADVTGAFDAETQDFNLALVASAQDLSLGNAVPRGLLAGRTDLSVTAVRADEVLTLSDLSLQGNALRASGAARIGPEDSEIDITARLANVGLFTDALSGAATADATITRTGTEPWRVVADLGGPGGMNANVAGQVGLPDGSVDLTANGTAPLALANQFIRPRSITGTLAFDLAMRGQPGLGALSGTLRTSDARLSAPTLSFAVQNIDLTGQLSSGQLNLSGNGAISTGGQVTIGGGLNLGSPGLDGQVDLSLSNARLIDPTLYNALIERAELSISGRLAVAPQISGDVTLGESEIRVPEASLAGSAAIPDIRHVGETREQRLTRNFAGLLAQQGAGNGGGSGGSNATGLDININAPSRIFVRGRGLDAEFGGSIRIFGTTANVIPTGRFDLIRGRLSVLGTRLDLTEGQATLQGSFDPFLRIAATSRANGYQITISMEGPVSDPDITFASDPSLPEDEVLARLLFGRSVSGLSPLQLLQLADAATSLAGGSTNAGFVAGLRDGLGLDDLDLSTDEEGNAAVTAGRYLSDNIYTDVTVNADGEADLSLNIDLTPNITARGSVGSDGGSSLGIFFEQDY
ncbi:translocation/assembly module TamB domain-containing protein [Gymnodinialimonas sp. 2305UL16-5]|uniref:translocation/assembly module TamB domain-containing protein n=1 Tax=Gymnodinialimonas mytili TaxID=3126503 RepID=UPI0030ADF9D5